MESTGNFKVSLRGCMDELHLGNMFRVGILAGKASCCVLY